MNLIWALFNITVIYKNYKGGFKLYLDFDSLNPSVRCNMYGSYTNLKKRISRNKLLSLAKNKTYQNSGCNWSNFVDLNLKEEAPRTVKMINFGFHILNIQSIVASVKVRKSWSLAFGILYVQGEKKNLDIAIDPSFWNREDCRQCILSKAFAEHYMNFSWFSFLHCNALKICTFKARLDELNNSLRSPKLASFAIFLVSHRIIEVASMRPRPNHKSASYNWTGLKKRIAQFYCRLKFGFWHSQPSMQLVLTPYRTEFIVRTLIFLCWDANLEA